jgi:hypothetical protein
MPYLLRDTAVNRLATECRHRGLAVSDYRCWKLLEHIDRRGDYHVKRPDVEAIAITALTLEPRPQWVQDITGLKP